MGSNFSLAREHPEPGFFFQPWGLGVDIFFVLSGMILSMVYGRDLQRDVSWAWYKNFVARRFAKIYPMHLITFLLMASLVLLARLLHYRFLGPAENNWWTALCSVLLIHSFGLTQADSWNYPSWSVSAEWFAYTVLFAPVLFGLRRWKIAPIASLAASLWIGMLLICRYWFNSSPTPTFRGVVRIIPEFLCGYLLYRLLENRNLRYGEAWFICGGLLLMLAIRPGNLYWLLMPAIMMMLAGAYAGGPVANRILGNRIAVFLGEASYSIYLVQAFSIVAFNQVVRRLHLVMGPGGLFGVLAIETVAVALTGVLSFRYVEEPLRQRLLQVFSVTRRNPEVLPVAAAASGLAPDAQVSGTAG